MESDTPSAVALSTFSSSCIFTISSPLVFGVSFIVSGLFTCTPLASLIVPSGPIASLSGAGNFGCSFFALSWISSRFLRCCSSRYFPSSSIISWIARASVCLSCSVSSIPASYLLFISASFCCASGDVSFRSSSIATFLRFSPSGFANSSSATNHRSHDIVALITPHPCSHPSIPAVLNRFFII